MANHINLFNPLKIQSVEFKNRIWVSPMCQYSSINGHPTDWHFVHLASRAIGGAGLVMVEATAVSPEGRISPDDSGIWSDEHIASFKRITDMIKDQGSIVGIQIAHAGRKGSTSAPWEKNPKTLSETQRGWQTIAPSPIAFDQNKTVPKEMSLREIQQCIKDFIAAAERCLAAGFQVLELHMAHGYLMHEFLSPLSNQRTDNYGGSLENRMRLPLEIAKAVRAVWPEEFPLFARISTTDWAYGPPELKANQDVAYNSWNVFESITFAQKLKQIGIDLIDCSSGGTLPHAVIPIGPSYQVSFAALIRKEAQIMTAAVGLITEPVQAESILLSEQADAVFLGREFLRNPYWPFKAARELGVDYPKPKQYALS